MYHALCHRKNVDKQNSKDIQYVLVISIQMDKRIRGKLEEYKIKDDIKEIEFDEMWHFLYKKT